MSDMLPTGSVGILFFEIRFGDCVGHAQNLIAMLGINAVDTPAVILIFREF
jgi:hypothetical protein